MSHPVSSKKNQKRRRVNPNPYESAASYPYQPYSPHQAQEVGNSVFDELLGFAPPQQDQAEYYQRSYGSGDNFEQVSQGYETFASERDAAAYEYQFFQQRKREFEAYVQEETAKEQEQIAKIQEVIRQEIEAFKLQQAAMQEHLQQLHKISLEQTRAKKGVYEIRFLELVVQILRNLRAKAAESNTWMEAMISRKKKRGSLFAVRAKEKGTQYSMSQELSVARSTQ
jgi:tRNA(Ser,Leu) C12 N-acetylase TAN1